MRSTHICYFVDSHYTQECHPAPFTLSQSGLHLGMEQIPTTNSISPQLNLETNEDYEMIQDYCSQASCSLCHTLLLAYLECVNQFSCTWLTCSQLESSLQIPSDIGSDSTKHLAHLILHDWPIDRCFYWHLTGTFNPGYQTPSSNLLKSLINVVSQSCFFLNP